MTKIARWCEHCNRPGHTREKCWKLHGQPPRGYKGCAPQDGTYDKEKQFSSRSTPFLRQNRQTVQHVFRSQE